MIRGDPYVRRAPVDHSENGREYTAHGADLPAVRIPRGRKRVVVPEELVGAVDEIHVHRRVQVSSISVDMACCRPASIVDVCFEHRSNRMVNLPSKATRTAAVRLQHALL